MNKAIAAALVAAFLASSPSWADDQLHCPTQGTRISFNTYAPIEFVGQENLVCLVKVADSKSPGGVRVAHVLLGLSEASPWVDGHVERLWPFKIGNAVEFEHSGDSSHIAGNVTSTDRIYYRDTITVLRQETLVTKAGTFDTFVIEDRQISLSHGLNGTWVNTFWWAPDVGYFVKRVYEVRAGLGQNTTSEIASLKVPSLVSRPATSSATPAPTTPAALPAPVPVAQRPTPPPDQVVTGKQIAPAESQPQQTGSPDTSTAPIQFHCPRPGTVVEYNTGAVLTFSKAGAGFVCPYSDTTGDRSKYAGFADDVVLLNGGLDRFWPLVVGAQQDMTVSPGSASSASYAGTNERFTVVRREVITLPAGTFDAVLVEQHEATSGGNNAQEASRRFWWAPDLGLVVKSTYLSIREPRFAQSVPSSIVPGDYVAVRIGVPGQAPAATSFTPAPPPARAPTVTPATASPPAASPSPAERLQALKDLFDHKLITPSEYEAKRKAIIDAM